MNCRNDTQGFSLIEIAIVLVIVGLLVGMGAGMVGPLTKKVKIKETKEIIDAAVESVISFGASASSLPDAVTFPTIVRKTDDTWRNGLNYIFDDNLLDPSIGGICGRSSTRLTINICFSAGCGSPNVIENVAYMILSSGGNFNNQTEASPVTMPATVNVYDTGVSVDNYSGGGDPSNVEPYDDIVKWITLDELRIKAGCKASQIRIVNNELPYGFQGSSYNASVFGNGGVPFADGADTGSELDYEWCWMEDPVNGPPTGVTFTCDTGLASSATCSLIAGTWNQCTSVRLTGTPTTNGSYIATFFVRDENDASGSDDNISQKSFVITINPSAGGCSSSCTDFRVWNNLGGDYDFLRDGDCQRRNDGNEVTNGGRRLNSGETIERHSTNNDSCGGIVETFTFNNAECADSDGDCRVNFDGTDR